MTPHVFVIRMRHRTLIIGNSVKMFHSTETPTEARGRTYNSPKGWMDSKVSKIPAEVGWKTFNSLCTSCLVMYICQFIAVTCQLQHVHLRAYRWGAFGCKKICKNP
jgi:hypothetical protein